MIMLQEVFKCGLTFFFFSLAVKVSHCLKKLCISSTQGVFTQIHLSCCDTQCVFMNLI